jgi:catechol-2,3-dioxygenase
VPVRRLNHAVLYVRDAARSAAFYREVLGFRPVSLGDVELPGAVFLQAEASTNDHDLALFQVGPQAGPSTAGRGSVGLYHLAWEVETLADLQAVAQRLAAAGALSGASDHSTTKALYAKDPDGLEFEVSWIVPADRLTDDVLAGRATIRRLDLDAEIERYGARTVGGLGVSVPT